jgi:malonyl-CoA decarboxylase
MRKSEILAFVQIALTDQVSSNIQSILREDTSTDDQATRTCAIFYSISSTQRGLSGIDLGQSLIKAAVRELQQEFPSLKTFCTLSPIPGLRRWLESVSDKEKLSRELKLPCDSITLLEGYESAPATFAQDDRLAAIFTTLAARYLFHEKRKRQALDPVGNNPLHHLNVPQITLY